MRTKSSADALRPSSHSVRFSGRGLYATLLVSLAIAFYIPYIRSVVPPQTGWVQDIAARMCSGEQIYLDFYWYTPPYFPWLTALIYSVFGNHMLLYTALGLVVSRLIPLLLLFYFLNKVMNPGLSVILLIAGMALNATYSAEQLYDTNPFLVTITLLQALTLEKALFSKSRGGEIGHTLLCGILSGIQIMIKQTSLSVAVACFIILIALCLLKKMSCSAHSLLLAMTIGVLLGVLPGLIYMAGVGSLAACIKCLALATSAKGGFNNSFDNIISTMFSFPDIIIVVGVWRIWAWAMRNHLQNSLRPSKRRLGLILHVGLVFIVVVTIFWRYAPLINSVAALLNAHGINYQIALLTLLCAFALFPACMIVVLRGRFGTKCPLVLLSILLICTILTLPLFGSDRIGSLLDASSLSSIKPAILLQLFYAYVLIWCISLYSILRKGSEITPQFILTSAYLGFISATLFSATIQELYILPIFAVVGSCAANQLEDHFGWRAASSLLTPLASMLILICLSQKLIVPYSWHSWSIYSLCNSADPVRSTNISGLEGVILPESQATQYEQLVATIEKYASDGDEVYQFPSIPLFNVLTGHRSQRYLAVPWFDVAPDLLAEVSADSLWNDPPEFVIWGEVGTDWGVLEQVYRGGDESGQRAIQDFYENMVVKNYTLLYYVENNSTTGYGISLWMRTT